MSKFTQRTADGFLQLACDELLHAGTVTDRRGGKINELFMAHFSIECPRARYITLPGRKVSLPAQIAETMWVLAGRNDIEWLSHYLPRAKDFSDDGKTWRAAYGRRIRNWNGVDQLGHVIKLLREDSMTRRAVISLYDPAVDSSPGKDIACNNWLHFIQDPRTGALNLHVATRSNDLMWGWSGINQFEWSALLEIVARFVNRDVGAITYDVSSLHVYERHFKKMRELVDSPLPPLRVGMRFSAPEDNEFQRLIDRWFSIERMIREEPRGSAWRYIRQFPEPMLREWLYVLYAWHFPESEEALDALSPVVRDCLKASPKRKVEEAEPGADGGSFLSYVVQLHNEKSDAYGDSWRKRGEVVGILGNIARKLDRFGVAGAGDTSADTVVDLLVYLVKYRIWLSFGDLEHGLEKQEVALRLDWLESAYGDRQEAGDEREVLEEKFDRDEREVLEEKFDRLEREVLEDSWGRIDLVNGMLETTYPVAKRLWEKEQQWKAGNATRAWKGYDQ